MNNIIDDMHARILTGLESTDQSIDDVKNSLITSGYDPDKELAAFKARLSSIISRHTWKAEARAKQSAFNNKVMSIISWASRSSEDIDAAFKTLMANQKTPHGLAMAFRNLDAITLEDKIAILNDYALLNHDDTSLQ